MSPWTCIVLFPPLLALSVSCTTQEKAIVKTVIDIAKVVCTDQDTIDACVDKILADKQVQAARAARTSGSK